MTDLRARLTALGAELRQPIDASVFGTEVAYAVYEEARMDCADKIAALLREPPEATCSTCGRVTTDYALLPARVRCRLCQPALATPDEP